MKIKDLPIEIQKLAELRWSECKNKAKHKIFDNNNDIYNCFEYAKTIEGSLFWNNIKKGNYDEYYKLYPKVVKPKIDSIINEENRTIYFASINNKKARITIEYYE